MLRGAVEVSMPLLFRRSGIMHLWVSVYRVDGIGVAFCFVELQRVTWLRTWAPGGSGK